jgi:hypothetical protein
VKVRTRAGSGDGVPQHEPGGGGEEGLQPQRQGALRAGDRHREDGAGEADVSRYTGPPHGEGEEFFCLYRHFVVQSLYKVCTERQFDMNRRRKPH